MKHDAFYDARLNPQQNKAVEMLRNGLTRPEICEEMDIDVKHLSTLFYQARTRGLIVPKHTSGPKKAPRNKIPIGDLVRMRAVLIDSGFKHAGMFNVMAERTGLSVNCIKVRLWKYDHGQRPKYSEGQAP